MCKNERMPPHPCGHLTITCEGWLVLYVHHVRSWVLNLCHLLWLQVPYPPKLSFQAQKCQFLWLSLSWERLLKIAEGYWQVSRRFFSHFQETYLDYVKVLYFIGIVLLMHYKICDNLQTCYKLGKKLLKDGRGWQLGSQWVAHSQCSNLYWQKYNREPSDRKTKNCSFEILTFHELLDWFHVNLL